VDAAPVASGRGVRVYFRRTQPGTADALPRLKAEAGALHEIVYSPDTLGVSVLWTNPAGTLRCEFPYGGTGVFASGASVPGGFVEYVYVEVDGARVTGRVPRGCPLLPEVELRVEPEDARVEPGGEGIVTSTGFIPPSDERGTLREGVYRLVLVTPRGRFPFLLAIDADGIPSALSGYVQNW